MLITLNKTMNKVIHGMWLTATPFVVVVVVSALITSCIGPHFVTDPHSKTPGYRIFRGTSEGFRISFEYPEKWRRLSPEKYDTYYVIFLYVTGKNASISISSDMNAAYGGEFENANASIEHSVNISSNGLEFQVISRGNISLGSGEWQELVYSFRDKDYGLDPHMPVGTVTDKISVDRELALDYKTRVYEIGLSVDYDEYARVNRDFDHLLATFRFLD